MNKQETLEKAAETNSEKHHYAFGQQSEFYQIGFIEGVKWQQERRYSEEDMKQAYLDGCKIKLTNIYHLEKWFEQFKKK